MVAWGSSWISCSLFAMASSVGEPAIPELPVESDPTDSPQGAIAIDPPGSPAAGDDFDRRPNHQRAESKTVFVNFDGGYLSNCFGGPQDNCSGILTGNVLPYSGDAAKRASVVQSIRKRLEPFAIKVTSQRPSSGDYDMEMVGNWQGQSPDFAGVAPSIDCWDNDGGEVSFTLEVAASADGTAEIILQEVAHTWGLEHVDNVSDLLFPTTQGSFKTFTDQCLKIVSNTDLDPSSGRCGSVHSNFCSSGYQNSYQDLLLVFGEAIPDTVSPALNIVNPADGEVIEGGDVDLAVEFEDDEIPAVVKLTLELASDSLDAPQQATNAYASPGDVTFSITNLPSGTYTASLSLADESDNITNGSVTFTIENDPTPAGSDDGGENPSTSSASSTSGSPGSGDDGGASESDTETDGASMNASDTSGCACRVRPVPSLSALILALLALGWRRRC